MTNQSTKEFTMVSEKRWWRSSYFFLNVIFIPLYYVITNSNNFPILMEPNFRSFVCNGGVSIQLILLVWNIYHTVEKETVIFLPTMGVQIRQDNSFGRTCFARFVPRSNIKALVINETIRRQRVITYLALLLNAPDGFGKVIIPVFHETLPRLHIIESVYRETHQIFV